MYYLSRFLILLCIGGLLLVILHLTGVIPLERTQSTFRKRVSGNIVFIGLVFCVISILQIPVEDFFISFPTFEESLNYRLLQHEEMVVHDCGDCFFAADSNGTLHTAKKNGNGCGIADVHILAHCYSIPKDYCGGKLQCRALTNEDTGKTAYFLSIIKNRDMPENPELLFDGEAVEELPMSASNERASRYLVIREGKILKNLNITLNGTTLTIY